MKTLTRPAAPLASALMLLLSGDALWAQATTQPANATNNSAVTEDEEELITLTPFEVSAGNESGYTAATTLAGNRLNTELRDLGNAVSVVTSQFMKDIAATNNETLLQYTTNTEVGNIQGNFTGLGDSAQLNETDRFRNPNQNTRVRGLTSADNTRDYFLTNIPWEGYNVDRVDLQRGPNSILFGQGSPAGIINNGTKQARFKNSNEVELRYGRWGSYRGMLDINRVLIRDELALRVIGVYNDEQFQQDPAYQLDKRIFGTTRWEPGFLKKGGARTVVRANFEAGDRRSNRPRTLPPYDFITPWFYSGTYQGRFANGDPRTFNNLNRETFNAFQLQDDNTGRPNHGQARPSINGGPNAGQPNPAFNPWIGNFGQSFGGPLAYWGSPTGAPQYWLQEIRTDRGIGTNGAIDRSIGGYAFHRMGGIAPYFTYARNANLPFSEFGVYKNRSLTDPTVFDFYNNLLEGPNKKEWADFNVFNVSLAQTFFEDRIGFEAVYNREDYKDGQLSFLTDTRQAINIDFMSVYNNGTPAGANGEPFQNGTPNPNVGRAFITDSGQGGNNTLDSEREAARVTVFGRHDFTQGGERGWVRRLLGSHTVTGLYAQDSQRTDSRSFQRWAVLDPEFRTFLGNTAQMRFTDNALAVNPVVYLGPSLANRTTASGAMIPGLKQVITPVSGTIRAFDSTWNAPGVDPAAPWENEYYPVGNASRMSTQSENPANYVGWRDVPLRIADAEKGDRDALTTSAELRRFRTMSRAAVWQGHFWDNSIVATAGIRKDVAKRWNFRRQSGQNAGIAGSGVSQFGQIDLGPTYSLPSNPSNRLEVTSKSWMVVGHLTNFIGDRSPIRVSAFYNKSENFQPEAGRVDIYGEEIAPPKGETTDQGLLFETKDGKYSFRINKYKTVATNASSNALGGSWFIGASQAWAGNWANRFEFDWQGDTIDRAAINPDPTRTEYNYGPGPGETLADAQRREAAAIAAWRSWQKSVDPRFYKAWGINLNDPTRSITSSQPTGFQLTEDSESKGWEYEFSAVPVKNWRITFNAAQTKATRKNIGGKALADFIAAYEKALTTTAAGDLRIWWGGAGNETTLFQWRNNVGSEYAQRRLQEGTNVPELREWRFNMITNYDFDRGFLKGVNVGGGVRWQDEIVIGYRPVAGPNNTISFDIANPYMGPSETNFDFWIGYGRRIAKNIDWRIQLNVRNAFEDDSLIPITTQPDGTPAAYRIAPTQVWTVTNTFKF
jgi:outer membrane receptor protein involved in Fe transport